MKRLFRVILSFSVLFCFLELVSAENPPKYLPIKYGDFESWAVRYIKESRMVGGNTRTVYAIGKMDTIRENAPYNDETTPWAGSNTYAKVKGIEIGSNSVYPHLHKNGCCALIRTEKVKLKVMRMINLEIVNAGAIYLGEIHEPITSMKNPYENISMGIPFKQKAKALVFDYRTNLKLEGKLLVPDGMSVQEAEGNDPAQIFVLLQHRWEDEKGKIYSKRIATAAKLFSENCDWVEGCRLPLVYGENQIAEDIPLLAQIADIFYTRNSEGEMTEINEVGLAEDGLEPTHIIVFISSGSQGAYKGVLGSEFYVDNIKFEL